LVEPLSILMPGGLRLRVVRPLVDRDGTYPLLFDLERSQLIDVPADFRYYVGSALDTGDLDESLLSWLRSEDVLTGERRLGGEGLDWGATPWSETGDEPWGEPSPELPANRVLFVHHRFLCRLELEPAAASRADLAAVLQGIGSSAPLTLVLGGAGPVRRFDLARAMVAEVDRHVRAHGREVAYEMTVDAAAVDAETAAFLADRPFRLRVPVGGSADAAEARRAGLRLLLARLPERVTGQAELDAGERLADLWGWAKAAGLRRLDVARRCDAAGVQSGDRERDVRAFRDDLFAVSDEIFAALKAGAAPPLYEPIARIVRRLMAGRPLTGRRGDEGGCFGMVSNGQIVPFYGGVYPLGFAGDAAAEDLPPAAFRRTIACDVCAGPCRCDPDAAGDSIGDEAPPARRPGCEFRRAEVEVAILLFARLRAADSSGRLLGFPTDGPEADCAGPTGASPLDLKVC
jgi:hypothetical protein